MTTPPRVPYPYGRRTFPASEIGRGQHHAVVYARRQPKRGDRLRFPDERTEFVSESIDSRRKGEVIRHIVRFQARPPMPLTR